MAKQSIELVCGVFVHTKDFGDSKWQHVKVQSEKHAERIVGLLGWNDYSGGAGRFFRHTWYNPGRKQVVSRCGYDI